MTGSRSGRTVNTMSSNTDSVSVEDLTSDLYRRITTATGGDHGAILELVARVERHLGQLRQRLAVALVLDHGASYAEVGRRLGVSRQAAHDAYASEVRAEMHRRIRH